MSNLVNFDFENISAGIVRLINQPTLLEKFWKEIKPEYFFYGDKSLKIRGLRKILEMIVDRCRKGETAIITTHYIDSLLHQTVDSEDNNEAKTQFRSMVSDPSIIGKSVDEGSFSIFLDFLKATLIIEWSQDFTKNYKNGEIGSAIEGMKDVLPRLESFKEDTVTTLDFEKIEEMFKVAESTLSKPLLLGCPPLDVDIGGFEKQTLTLFITVTNGGKSMMAHHLLRQCVQMELPVHITCVEDRPLSFSRRIISAVTGIEIKKLKEFNTLSPTEKASIREWSRKLAKFVKVDFMYGESISSVHKRKLEYDAERKIKGLDPYVVDIVDYTAHIASKSSGDKKYEQTHTAYSERKDFCLKYDKIAFDFAQINREGNHKNSDAKILTHADLAASYDLSQVCDTIISINRSKAQREIGKATLHVCKGRDGHVGGLYTVVTDFAKARWNMETAVYENPTITNNVVSEGSLIQQSTPVL